MTLGRVVESQSHVARPGTEGESAPDEPVLLVGPYPWWEANGLVDSFRASGWGWISAADSTRAKWLASIQKVSLVVIGGDHNERWNTLQEVRSVTGAPVVVLTDDDSEIVSLVEAGVDGVLNPNDGALVHFARMVALLRRADHRWGPGVRYLRSGDLSVDLWTRQSWLNGVNMQLSPTESALLTFLMTRPDVALSTNVIVDRVWGWRPSDGKNALRIIVNRLRRKLNDDPREPRFVASVRSVGYRFVGSVTEVSDAPDQHSHHVDVTPLLDALTLFAGALQAPRTVHEIGEVLLDSLEISGMAIFRLDGAVLILVGARHMSDAWMEGVRDGMPLDPSFAGARSVLTGETVQFADVRAMAGDFSSSVRLLADDDFRAGHFVPIICRGEPWGHLGIVRRSCQPLDETAMSFLRSLASIFALGVLSAREDTAIADQH
jgi:two-component system, OmpR family, KDP operon response regulator KdpE